MEQGVDPVIDGRTLGFTRSRPTAGVTERESLADVYFDTVFDDSICDAETNQVFTRISRNTWMQCVCTSR